jgi:hypothetical protein
MEYAVGKLLYCHAPPHFDYDTFQKETLTTAIRNTKKLRNKLVDENAPALHRMEEEEHNENEEEEDDGDDDDNDDDDDDSVAMGIEDDDMMLELMGDTALDDSRDSSSGAKTNNNAARQKKWGKKGRKLRNKDPYGCHSTPDESLAGSKGITGVTVKGGKKHSRNNYVRPTGYGMAAPSTVLG